MMLREVTLNILWNNNHQCTLVDHRSFPTYPSVLSSGILIRPSSSSRVSSLPISMTRKGS
ncbi:uncharacterized protein BJ212DRAFT_1312711 [Suillus subaureus]|uniref:Uncharacterized protein n=1 Tax=Suillus subaureus TaxID=48587 RepID=A0A9P7EQU9_9AGAM|nr:uncharacterized protein BJ212DRAFT_1312711 [Suillus subaureus]KAG1827498.1 hypothetical protein BJ212DRAFT_1312711 [Suillus subaureus]